MITVFLHNKKEMHKITGIHLFRKEDTILISKNVYTVSRSYFQAPENVFIVEIIFTE